MWSPKRPLLDVMANAIGGDTFPAGHTLTGAFLCLFKAVPSTDPDVGFGDDSIKEADFSGYARASVGAGSGVYVGQGNGSLQEYGANLFTCDSTTTVNTIYAQGILGSDSVTLLAVELFDTPIPLPGPGAGLVTTPIVGAKVNTAGYGNSAVSN